MSKKKEPSIKIKETDYWYCDRCKIDSLGKQMCPCPRGSCEAEEVGTVITTVEVKIHPPKPVEPTPKINYPLVEEMRCPTCEAVTGHIVKDNKWTCVHCETPLK